MPDASPSCQKRISGWLEKDLALPLALSPSHPNNCLWPPVASERTIDSCPGKFPGRETPRQPVTSGASATCARRTAPCGAAGGGLKL